MIPIFPQQIESRLPPEPPAGSKAKVARLRVRVPAGDDDDDKSGGNLERRFLASDTLAVLLDYLASKGFHPDEYKVLSSWPRRDVSDFFTVFLETVLSSAQL